jgi:O-antigen/teichoic acid export membrane protein
VSGATPLPKAPDILLRLFDALPFSARLASLFGGAMQVFMVRVLGAGLTYASMVLLARWLGAFQFGVYAYVSVLVTLLGVGLSFGLNASGLRFISTYLGRGKRARLAGFLVQSHWLVLLLSTVGALAGAGLVYAMRGFIPDYYLAPVLVGFACVPLYSVMNQLEATARAFGWLPTAYVPTYILRPLTLLLIVGGVVACTGHADAVSTVVALTAACAVATLVQAVLVYRGVRPSVSGIRPAFHTRHWLVVSLGFLMIDGFRMLLDNTDLLLIGRLLDPQSVAAYYAVIRTGNLLAFIAFSVTALAVPTFARIHSSGTREELQAFVMNTIRTMFWPTLAAALALAIAGRFLLSLFGADFVAGYPALLVVLCGLVLRAASAPVEYLLTMTGHHQDTIKVYGAAAAASIVLNLLLIPAWGIVGAAVASYTAMLAANSCLYVLVRKRLGVSAFIGASGTRFSFGFAKSS